MDLPFVLRQEHLAAMALLGLKVPLALQEAAGPRVTQAVTAHLDQPVPPARLVLLVKALRTIQPLLPR